jgi:hypothetical protein
MGGGRRRRPKPVGAKEAGAGRRGAEGAAVQAHMGVCAAAGRGGRERKGARFSFHGLWWALIRFIVGYVFIFRKIYIGFAAWRFVSVWALSSFLLLDRCPTCLDRTYFVILFFYFFHFTKIYYRFSKFSKTNLPLTVPNGGRGKPPKTTAVAGATVPNSLSTCSRCVPWRLGSVYFQKS